jgi:hypothetical protein
MSSESVCYVVRNWVDVGSFHTRLVVRFMIGTASVRDILDVTSCVCVQFEPTAPSVNTIQFMLYCFTLYALHSSTCFS